MTTMLLVLTVCLLICVILRLKAQARQREEANRRFVHTYYTTSHFLSRGLTGDKKKDTALLHYLKGHLATLEAPHVSPTLFNLHLRHVNALISSYQMLYADTIDSDVQAQCEGLNAHVRESLNCCV